MAISVRLSPDAPQTGKAARSAPFSDFASPISPPSELRRRISAAIRRPEPECVRDLIVAASLSAETRAVATQTATRLVETLRAKGPPAGVEGLIQEYSLSSDEGLALMRLAEALLRIPDAATRDALIRDKIADGDWLSHLGRDRAASVNAATLGLFVTGGLTDRDANVLTRLVARCGEPFIRKGVELAMRRLGEQFVAGRTIEEAIRNGRRREAKGFRYSYDMLGEAAMTAEDAARYFSDYETAIHAIGKHAAGRGLHEGPGVSIKLSALHPRYGRAQAERVMRELLPRLKSLAALARRYGVGLNIDAEEADRLEISLDLLEALCLDPDLAGWDGIGFVVQAYGKRCPFVIDFLIDLARRSGHRLMVRLVKGAYWDAEIKRSQVDGLEDYPVFTRKLHTDVSYIAAAKQLLAATDAVFPQFATHNAHTLATVHAMAGDNFSIGRYEFQCLHGMGEPLYEQVIAPSGLNRPCRIYAPVGTHETLLAYLVRRLLENGANSSFVNRVADPDASIADLVADPVESARAMDVVGAPHEKISAPADLYAPERANSAGLDLTDENTLAHLSKTLAAEAMTLRRAAPLLANGEGFGTSRPVLNPGDHGDVIGHVVEASEEDAAASMRQAVLAVPRWSEIPVSERAARLARAADFMQARMPAFLNLLVREAGKSLPNAVAEAREAIDFLRYYGVRAKRLPWDSMPLGPVVCISPWNFPLAIFTGQIAAALVAGNPVVAKPAEETPLIAAEAVRLLHEAGVPRDALQLLPGDGRIGAALVSDPAVCGVMFTGSTEVARLIQRRLAERLLPDGRPIPLIAETGGQNAMIVDSSALAEQVVADVITSAFDSAGQRCSALRILCLQEDIADRTLAMLKGALRELHVGRTDRLSVDVGPVITTEAKERIDAHISAMRARGRRVEQLPLPASCAAGTFTPPTIIEIDRISDVTCEVFGPVLHVLRWRRETLDRLIEEINATGYGLTFGLHTRLDERIAHVTSRIRVGNVYVNRNVIGAVVGLQPFGGRGLSGSGPKAGGPLYLSRLIRAGAAASAGAGILAPCEGEPASPPAPLDAFARWLDAQGHAAEAEACRAYGARSRVGLSADLPGPVGERNVYTLHPRGCILLLPATRRGLYLQIAATLATGNDAVIDAPDALRTALDELPASVSRHISVDQNWERRDALSAALIEADADRMLSLCRRLAAREGAIVPAHGASLEDVARSATPYRLEGLLEEVSISTNTAAAGGNASLMTIG